MRKHIDDVANGLFSVTLCIATVAFFVSLIGS